mmetsp:Transcript_23463/g.58256  ORF Transcript_23463/g.58256 Transcript_23463/m.58256 type:complete len:206 (+) Transcript_23463:178-795(+)
MPAKNMVLQIRDLRAPVLTIRTPIPADLLVHRPHVLVEIPAALRAVPADAALQGPAAAAAGRGCYPSFAPFVLALAMVACTGRVSLFGADAWNYNTPFFIRPDAPSHYFQHDNGGFFNYKVFYQAFSDGERHCFGTEFFQYEALREEGAVEWFPGVPPGRVRGFEKLDEWWLGGNSTPPWAKAARNGKDESKKGRGAKRKGGKKR